jgi:hypothetical protein
LRRLPRGGAGTLPLVDNIDAVRGLYYLVTHGWFTTFPVTDFWSRLSSCQTARPHAVHPVQSSR